MDPFLAAGKPPCFSTLRPSQALLIAFSMSTRATVVKPKEARPSAALLSTSVKCCATSRSLLYLLPICFGLAISETPSLRMQCKMQKSYSMCLQSLKKANAQPKRCVVAMFFNTQVILPHVFYCILLCLFEAKCRHTNVRKKYLTRIL